MGLTKTNVKLDNDKLECSFTRKKFVANVENYFDLNNKYYLLFARGSLGQSGMTAIILKQLHLIDLI